MSMNPNADRLAAMLPKPTPIPDHVKQGLIRHCQKRIREIREMTVACGYAIQSNEWRSAMATANGYNNAIERIRNLD